MGSLRINKVLYQGDRYVFESPIFQNNLIMIEGDNGTGKTTFCNLIYFGLGGKVQEFEKVGDKKHKEITGDSNNFVELYVSISGNKYQLRRFIDENDVTITPYSVLTDPATGEVSFSTDLHATETIILPIYRSGAAKYIFSDWILGLLGISVIELYQGYTTFKVNVTELLRLMYHDQQPDPGRVYKRIDTKSNYVSDSELLRKAIFELLIGKSFSEYYDSIVTSKEAEKEKAFAKALLDESTRLADLLRGTQEMKNKSFLENELREKQNQIERLQQARITFKRNRSADSSIDPAIAQIKNQLTEYEIARSVNNDGLLALYDEKSKLFSIKEITAKEIDQVNKIIHSHDQLNLFAADTCPYCLSKVDRAAGHCVCGSEIDEKQYERFFYTSNEYKEILKSKTKTLATIDLALADCNDEIGRLRVKIEDADIQIPILLTALRGKLEGLDKPMDFDGINDIDDKILETREEISSLSQRIESEAKLDRLSTDYESKRLAHQKATLEMKRLENMTKIEIEEKVSAFSAKYNKFVTETLSDCRSARISIDNYLPIINEGEYKEASSGVSIRLMYFLTLLDMSLSQSDVPFPKFLLIDTPETAGIELTNLVNCLKKFEGLDEYKTDYQVILTTGLSKYPPGFIGNRSIYLPDKQHALLKPRQ